MLYLRKIITHSQKVATYFDALISQSKLKLEVVSTRTLYIGLFMQFPEVSSCLRNTAIQIKKLLTVNNYIYRRENIAPRECRLI